MVDQTVKPKRGRPSGSQKRFTEQLLDLYHYVGYGRMAEGRRTGRIPSVNRFCEKLEKLGGWHEIVACDHAQEYKFEAAKVLPRGLPNEA
jgi:hypothetical protein